MAIGQRQGPRGKSPRGRYTERLANAVAVSRPRGNAAGGSQAGAAAEAGAAPGAAPAPGTGNKSKYNPGKVLNRLGSGEPLSAKQEREFARALTAIQIRKEVGSYKRTAQELHNERETEAKGLGTLGINLQGQVGSVYKDIATSAAQGLATQQAIANQLNQKSAQIGQEGQQSLAQMQGTQLGGVESSLALRGAPGGGTAQQELAAAVASQKAAQSATSQSQQQFAAQQGASYGQLAAAMAGATQGEGGAAVGHIGQAIVGRVGESGSKFDQDIREARAKLGEARANRGALYGKNLLEVRNANQKYELGKEAVKGEKAKIKLAEEEAAQGKKENAQKQAQIAKENAQWAKEFGLKSWEVQHPNAADKEVAKKRQEIRQDVREVKSLIGPAVTHFGSVPKTQAQLNELIGYLNEKASASPQLVQHVVNNWWEKARKRAVGHTHR